jgi:hypothetical protein
VRVSEDDKRRARRAWRIVLVAWGAIFLEFVAIPIWPVLLLEGTQAAPMMTRMYFKEHCFIPCFLAAVSMVVLQVLSCYRGIPRVRNLADAGIVVFLGVAFLLGVLLFVGEATLGVLVLLPLSLLAVVIPFLWAVWKREGPPWVAFERGYIMRLRLKRWRRWSKEQRIGRSRTVPT